MDVLRIRMTPASVAALDELCSFEGETNRSAMVRRLIVEGHRLRVASLTAAKIKESVVVRRKQMASGQKVRTPEQIAERAKRDEATRVAWANIEATQQAGRERMEREELERLERDARTAREAAEERDAYVWEFTYQRPDMSAPSMMIHRAEKYVDMAIAGLPSGSTWSLKVKGDVLRSGTV